MSKKRRRFWDGAKTVLIVLLSCSAVYLAGQTLFAPQLGGLLSRLPQSAETPGPATAAFSGQTLRPAALAVTWEDGRYGLLPYQDDQHTYTQVSALLAEALGCAGVPESVERDRWDKALAEPGLFCEYLGPMPLDVLSRWLSGQENGALSGVLTRRLCVAEKTLYFLDEAGEAYACGLSSDLSDALSNLAAQSSSNGASFAGESEVYPLLRSDALVLPGTPSLPLLLAEDPIPLTDLSAPGEALSQVLHALSFHPQTNALYSITGGCAINDGGETLRIDDQGRITYRRTDETAVRFPAGPSAYDATRALAEATAGSLCGEARLYLRDVRHSGVTQIITYGYAFRGVAIQQGQEGWCAQFTVENGAVVAFTIKLRRYTAQPELRNLLPQEQAAAALSGGEGQVLELLYEDNGQGQSMAPFWAVRREGR